MKNQQTGNPDGLIIIYDEWRRAGIVLISVSLHMLGAGTSFVQQSE
jgi:hypothetical protein